MLRTKSAGSSRSTSSSDGASSDDDPEPSGSSDFEEVDATSITSSKNCNPGAAWSNFAIQYNFTSLSIASVVMAGHLDRDGNDIAALYPEPGWVKQYILSIVFVGSVVGMLTMGYLGDLVGIKRALIATNAMTVLGALCSALCSWGSAERVWEVVTWSRFLLGVGVGGNYPLSAAKASHGVVTLQQAVTKAGIAFFWQGPGGAAPYLLGLMLFCTPVSGPVTQRIATDSSLQFRVLLGAGAIPALVVLALTIAEKDEQAKGPDEKKEKLQAALRDIKHWRTLVGTAGAWFLFDVAFYGTVIFSPTILQSIYGNQQSIGDLASSALVMALLGMLGTGVGIFALPRIGAKQLCVWGLAAASVLFAGFAVVYLYKPDFSKLLFACLSLLFFFLYAGPNVATYILPVEAFPQDVRSTFHGLSAAAAKIGAMGGALLFPVLDFNLGVPTVMATQSVICAAGSLLTLVAIQGGGGEGEGEDEGPPDGAVPGAASAFLSHRRGEPDL